MLIYWVKKQLQSDDLRKENHFGDLGIDGDNIIRISGKN
jgi:hypothetical protein